jgi:hypothetical protein
MTDVQNSGPTRTYARKPGRLGSLIAITAATLAAALTFIGTAHADVGEIDLIQANSQRILSISVEHANNITTPTTIAETETLGATILNVSNHTNESITVGADGRSAIVGPQQTVSLPETGRGLIQLAIPAGT